MYTEFFGLRKKPFSITPDPKFLYLSPAHKEALAHLIYGIRENTGFVVITGEVGTGKTTIMNALLMRIPARMPRVVIKNPNIRPENLYFLLGEAIGIPEDKRSRKYLHDYEDRLKEIGGALLLVDEAQGLSVEMLEEIRLLSNIETPREKLVQIMLLGQQELNEKLKKHQLRQLRQRIGIKYHIPPLDSVETVDYIEHRLNVAGYESKAKPIFTSSGMAEIYKQTKGFPRLINILCDNAMLAAYTEDTHQIGAKLIKRVVSDMEGTYGKTNMPSSRLSAPHKRIRVNLNWLMFSILITALCGGGVVAWHLLPRSAHYSNVSFIDMAAPQTTVASDGLTSGSSGVYQSSVPDKSTNANLQDTHADVTVSRQARVDSPNQNIISQGTYGDTTIPPIPPPLIDQERPKEVWITVKEGDTLADIAIEHYGKVNDEILKDVKEANPGIEDIDIIYEGQKILIPSISSSTSTLYSVSVASYHSIEEAKAVFSHLISKGFNATIYPYVDPQGRNWYRLTIGVFDTKQEAISYSKTLEEMGFLYVKPVKISMED
ncbi:MAG: AAA family ATPase [Deltaproteobacteria bacterium]|nr:AAA family ATPase [Deltaproteobacteria bacterium]